MRASRNYLTKPEASSWGHTTWSVRFFMSSTRCRRPQTAQSGPPYIRGSQGLARRIEEIRRITDAQLGYVGEWHSHPRGHGPSPSPDDRKVFAWLEQHMEPDGLPAVMLIVGEETAWYVEQMP
jgi:hypothetical protein